jgi:hypothetical protein
LKQPLNHSSNVGTSLSGCVSASVALANACLIARCSASCAPTLGVARSWYGPETPSVPKSRSFFPSGVLTVARKNQPLFLGSRRTGIVTALPSRPAMTTSPSIA